MSINENKTEKIVFRNDEKWFYNDNPVNVTSMYKI